MAESRSNYSAVVEALLHREGKRHHYIPPASVSEAQLEEFYQQVSDQANAKNAVAKVIYSAVSSWIGWEVRENDWLPVVREGKQVGRLGTFLPSEPVDLILRAASTRAIPDLKAERGRLVAFLAAAKAVQSSAATFNIREQFDLGRTWPEKNSRGVEPVDLIHAVGLWESLSISVHGVILNAESRLAEVESELSAQGTSLGRPPIRPTYEVAREFAFLYARVTGRTPTYSKDPNGYSGEFSPALEALARALGWEGRHLRQPAEQAVKAVTPEFIHSVEPQKTGLLGGVFGLGGLLSGPAASGKS